ncbi:MAG TPA: carboxypeptidase-like regulatory domain-containing protein [Bacteroidales bacterium]|nr:carboxypeptidase-like regulatory domain-containing protein [Bacteroidales bacterium]
MKTRNLILVLFLFLFIGCQKEENTLPHTTVSGHVYSTGSGSPVEGVTVYMYDGLPYSRGGSNRIDSAKTDANGYFHVELDGKEPVLDFFKENYDFEYTVGGAGIGIMPVDPGSNQIDVKVQLDGIAHFSPVLMNKFPQNDEDTVILYITNSKYNIDNDILDGKGNGPHYFWDAGLKDGFFYSWRSLSEI